MIISYSSYITVGVDIDGLHQPLGAIKYGLRVRGQLGVSSSHPPGRFPEMETLPFMDGICMCLVPACKYLHLVFEREW